MSKKIIGIIIAILVIAGVVFLAKRAPAPATPEEPAADATQTEGEQSAVQELEGIDTGSIESELQSIDADLKDLE